LINQNIFYLLKALHITLALKNSYKMVSLYAEKLIEHSYIKDIERVDERTIIRLCNELLISLINPISQEVNEEFKEKFKDSIFDLANVQPVVAYDLSKISYFEAFTEELNRILKKADFPNNQSKDYIDGFKDGILASQKHNLHELDTKLLKGIKNLSLKSGLLIWCSCHYEVFKLKQKFSENEMKSNLDNYFRKTVSPLMEKYKNNNESQ
jgi:hypothetical protein